MVYGNDGKAVGKSKSRRRPTLETRKFKNRKQTCSPPVTKTGSLLKSLENCTVSSLSNHSSQLSPPSTELITSKPVPDSPNIDVSSAESSEEEEKEEVDICQKFKWVGIKELHFGSIKFGPCFGKMGLDLVLETWASQPHSCKDGYYIHFNTKLMKCDVCPRNVQNVDNFILQLIIIEKCNSDHMRPSVSNPNLMDRGNLKDICQKMKLDEVEDESELSDEHLDRSLLLYCRNVNFWSSVNALAATVTSPPEALSGDLGVNELSRARIPPSSARVRLSCCRLELELGSFKVWYPSSSSAREKCKKFELGSTRLSVEPRLGSSSFMLFELD
ncbi:hypothetical protein LXL04_038394 [Taraxacum kok-saghyz]